MKAKILVLVANPLDTHQLSLDEEVRAIDIALRQAAFRDYYELVPQLAVRIDDLQELLLRHHPQIVHFSGHGSNDGELILHDVNGGSKPVSGEALSTLFALFKDEICCVVLNACYSAQQAEAIAQHIDAVIGIPATIDDDAAREFSAAFYRALAFGRSVKTAFDLGVNKIVLAGLARRGVPELMPSHADLTRATIPNSFVKSRSHYLWGLLTLIPIAVVVYFAWQFLLALVDVNVILLSQ